MKAFTSLEQSKKLAEILPIESADMYYWKRTWKEGDYSISVGHSKKTQEGFESKGFEYTPCWSLAALLSLIPQEIFDGEYIINITEGIDNKWIITYDHHENKNHSYYSLSIGADNLIDACYELILKLNILNLL